jgi:hypothetical protein
MLKQGSTRGAKMMTKATKRRSLGMEGNMARERMKLKPGQLLPWGERRRSGIGHACQLGRSLLY